jgi:hypothetical protein
MSFGSVLIGLGMLFLSLTVIVRPWRAQADKEVSPEGHGWRPGDGGEAYAVAAQGDRMNKPTTTKRPSSQNEMRFAIESSPWGGNAGRRTKRKLLAMEIVQIITDCHTPRGAERD